MGVTRLRPCVSQNDKLMPLPRVAFRMVSIDGRTRKSSVGKEENWRQGDYSIGRPMPARLMVIGHGIAHALRPVTGVADGKDGM